MEYRVLGKTGLEISRLGFGGIPIQKIDAEGTKVLVGELVDKGVNFIDTARRRVQAEARRAKRKRTPFGVLFLFGACD